MAKPIVWEEDRALIAARQHPGWCGFHRSCGSQGEGVYFEVERVSAPRETRLYRSKAVRFEKVRDNHWRSIEISCCEASEPIPAVIASFHAARESEDPHGRALDLAFVTPLTPADDEFDPMMELIG